MTHDTDYDCVRSIIVSLSLLSFRSLLSQLSIVPSRTIGSTGLLALLSRLLLSWLLLSRLLIVLTYYTAFNQHSIYSSTFPLYDSLSRVSCLSWQSTCP